MSENEKARQSGEPIFNAVPGRGSAESKSSLLDLQEPKFDYGVLAPDVASSLRNDAARLRSLITKSTADMIGIGCDLIAAKDRLEHGQFTAWVETEIRISIRAAQGYIPP